MRHKRNGASAAPLPTKGPDVAGSAMASPTPIETNPASWAVTWRENGGSAILATPGGLALALEVARTCQRGPPIDLELWEGPTPASLPLALAQRADSTFALARLGDALKVEQDGLTGYVPLMTWRLAWGVLRQAPGAFRWEPADGGVSVRVLAFRRPDGMRLTFCLTTGAGPEPGPA